MKTIALATLCCALAALIFNFFDDRPTPELTRVDCKEIAVFAPSSRGLSPESLCRAYGGIAKSGAKPSSEGLVILVRNQPMGGFSGQHWIR